jgi:hypothetical protein
MTNSPLNPQQDIQVVLRSSTNIAGEVLQGWFTDDVNKLATKFVHKPLKMGNEENMSMHKTNIYEQLTALTEKEGLIIIGAFQDSKTSDLHCLFYKLDKANPAKSEYTIDIYEGGPDGSTGDNAHESNIEELVNQSHLDMLGYLQCVISLRDKKGS